MREYEILSKINSPEDVRELTERELTALASEIRDIIIETAAKNGGHLASNLGMVEVTLAMHRVFSCPTDAFVFDVGHQAYGPKPRRGQLCLGNCGSQRHVRLLRDRYRRGEAHRRRSFLDGCRSR